jgi:hypothetical protein
VINHTARSVCPACLAKHRRDVLRHNNTLAERYGAVSCETFVALVQRRITPPREQLNESVTAEIDQDGHVVVRYSAECQHCRFKFDLHHTDQAALTPQHEDLPHDAFDSPF